MSDLRREVRAVIPHAPGCCAKGCIADRGPCCGTERCTCNAAATVAAVVRLIEAHRSPLIADAADVVMTQAAGNALRATAAAQRARADTAEAVVAHIRAARGKARTVQDYALSGFWVDLDAALDRGA